MTDAPLRLLYLDMNSYFASVEQQEDPRLRGRPVGVVTTMKPNAAIIAASYEAKARGLKFGLRLREAQRLIPDMQFRAARHDVYVDYHHRIKHAIEQVLPIEAAHSVDEFSVRLSGAAQNLQTALGLAWRMRAQIYADVGPAMRCSIGLGPSLLLAKLAGELKKPSGLEWLTPEVLPDKINHLKLRDIPGISRGIEARLNAAGITTISELYALPPKHARRIWGGVQGERFIRALQGEDIPLPVAKPARSLGHGQVLSYNNRNPDAARLVTRRLLIKAATRLRRQNAFATYLQISVKCGQNGRCGLGRKIPATQDSFQLLALFRQFWGELVFSQPISTGVMLGGLIPAHRHTADLFEQRPGAGQRTSRENLCTLIDAINQRYGQDTLIYGEAPREITPYTGAKIAFGRIPGREEFRD
jgi:nucleotidyltransferase/DNA polymerase involved in DNA repair